MMLGGRERNLYFPFVQLKSLLEVKRSPLSSGEDVDTDCKN